MVYVFCDRLETCLGVLPDFGPCVLESLDLLVYPKCISLNFLLHWTNDEKVTFFPFLLTTLMSTYGKIIQNSYKLFYHITHSSCFIMDYVLYWEMR